MKGWKRGFARGIVDEKKPENVESWYLKVEA